jgi:hypothetical protein
MLEMIQIIKIQKPYRSWSEFIIWGKNLIIFYDKIMDVVVVRVSFALFIGSKSRY